jgi:5'-nucleotidase
MTRVLVDMDEVIADTTLGMRNWYKQHYEGDIDFNKMLAEGSMTKGFPKEHQPIVRQQLFQPGFFRHLPVMEDSVDTLRLINEKYELFIVSAATEFPHSLTDKYFWLTDNYPFLTWKQLVLCGQKHMIEADIMIDDHARHLELFKGKPYIFTTPHNLNESRFERINNWKEAAQILL